MYGQKANARVSIISKRYVCDNHDGDGDDDDDEEDEDEDDEAKGGKMIDLIRYEYLGINP